MYLRPPDSTKIFNATLRRKSLPTPVVHHWCFVNTMLLILFVYYYGRQSAFFCCVHKSDKCLIVEPLRIAEGQTDSESLQLLEF